METVQVGELCAVGLVAWISQRAIIGLMLFGAENISMDYGTGGIAGAGAASGDVGPEGGSAGGSSALLLREVSFALEAGRIYDLLGRSGAGKSTLLRVCALMVGRSGGRLLLDGRSDSDFKPVEWRKAVCLVPQHVSLVPGSVRDNLLLPWTLKVRAAEKLPQDKELRRLLRLADLDVELDRDCARLSGGQAARVALLRAFATRPKVLLLDEVDAALDDESSAAVSALTWELVAGGGAGVECTCLRIRHRASDGKAAAAFWLEDGTLTQRVRNTSAPSRSEDGSSTAGIPAGPSAKEGTR